VCWEGEIGGSGRVLSQLSYGDDIHDGCRGDAEGEEFDVCVGGCMSGVTRMGEERRGGDRGFIGGGRVSAWLVLGCKGRLAGYV
jgi:hypothetical protein